MPNPVRSAEIAQRRLRVWKARNDGAAFEQIAIGEHVSPTQARKDYAAAADEQRRIADWRESAG